MPDNPRVKLYPSEGYLRYTPSRPDAAAVGRLAELVASAKHPAFVVGQGMQTDRARALLAEVAERAGVAVATSYSGKGAIDETAPSAVGMLGTWGARSANRMLGKADLVIVLGASLGPDYLRFRDEALIDPKRQTLVQVDIDPRHAGWVYPVDLAITADACDVLEALRAHGLGESMREARLAAIADNNREHGFGALPASVAGNGTLHYADIVRVLDRTLTARDMLVLDAGNNRIWVTTSLRIRTPGQLVVPGGIGGMGWGLPAAAGTRMARPDRNVICLIGDGGATMTLGAIATCVQEQLPITVLVANNNGLGMVRDNMKQRRIAVDFSPIDFAAIARGMGCQGIRVNRADALGDAIAQARDSGVTTVIDVAIDPEASHVPVSDY
jgi:acetolactate synthase-1/2/3 large subunit